jgi:hypothetical protein
MHTKDLFLLRRRLHLQSDQLLGRQIHALEDLAEAAAAQTPHHSPPLLHHVTRAQQRLRRRRHNRPFDRLFDRLLHSAQEFNAFFTLFSHLLSRPLVVP